MNEALTNILLSLVSFVGVTIVYFLKMSFAKLELLQVQIQELKIEIEKLKK
jgi:cell division protein FtsB